MSDQRGSMEVVSHRAALTQAAFGALAVSACVGALIVLPIVARLREDVQERYDRIAGPVLESARQVTREYYEPAFWITVSVFMSVFVALAVVIAYRVEHPLRHLISRELALAASFALVVQLPACLLFALAGGYSSRMLFGSGALALAGAAVVLASAIGRYVFVAVCLGAAGLTLGAARGAFLIAPVVVLLASMLAAAGLCALMRHGWRSVMTRDGSRGL